MTHPYPHDSALRRLADGQRLDSLAAAREPLDALMVELEGALTEAEDREARVANRRARRANPAVDRVRESRG